jgi:hypothetical protein
MPRIAITGHMNLAADSIPLVYKAITDALARYAVGELTGISCIARGADSIFAQAVLDLGGKLEVLLQPLVTESRKSSLITHCSLTS